MASEDRLERYVQKGRNNVRMILIVAVFTATDVALIYFGWKYYQRRKRLV